MGADEAFIYFGEFIYYELSMTILVRITVQKLSYSHVLHVYRYSHTYVVLALLSIEVYPVCVAVLIHMLYTYTSV